jgi:hypothetical protein
VDDNDTPWSSHISNPIQISNIKMNLQKSPNFNTPSKKNKTGLDQFQGLQINATFNNFRKICQKSQLPTRPDRTIQIDIL